jgi:sigma-B regulation protein RsbU (phosphoserine phosphatase)
LTRLDKLSEKLQLNQFKLKILLELTKAINNNVSTTELLEVYRSFIQTQLDVSKLMLFNDQNNWDCVLSYGVETEHTQIEPNVLFKGMDEICVLQPDTELGVQGFDVLIPVFHKNKPLAYLILGDLNEDELKISPVIKHMNFIQTITNVLVVAIENKRLLSENIIQERVKKELELAAEMQSMLVPKNFPNNSQIQIAAYYQPHQQVGGDYYDVIELNENELVFCVADVSGKGVSAAFLMSNFQANLNALVNYTDYSLVDMVEELNAQVLKSAMGEKFITLFIAKLNIKTGALRYVNAGHNPPILMHNKELFLLENGCIGLGMLDEIPSIKEGNIKLQKDATIVCYTDGLTEVENENKKQFGLESIGELMISHRETSMADLNELIIKAMNEFRGTAPLVDDTALLSCRFRR